MFNRRGIYSSLSMFGVLGLTHHEFLKLTQKKHYEELEGCEALPED